MNWRRTFQAIGAAVALASAPAACGGDRIDADCPAKAALSNGDSCSEDNLQCPYDVSDTACDGTVTTVASSCICQSGAWSCPDSWRCAEDGGSDAGASE